MYITLFLFSWRIRLFYTKRILYFSVAITLLLQILGNRCMGCPSTSNFGRTVPPAPRSPPMVLCYVMLCFVMVCYATLCYVMLCYVIRLFVKHLSQGTIQRRSQRDRLEKGKVFWHLRELGNIS